MVRLSISFSDYSYIKYTSANVNVTVDIKAILIVYW